MGDQIVLVAGSDEFFDIVREGGIVEIVYVSQVYNLLYQSEFFVRQVSAVTNNGCDLLHGNADGFDEVWLLYMKSAHDRVLDDHGDKKRGEKRQVDGFCLAAETEQQKGHGEKKGIPAV